MSNGSTTRPVCDLHIEITEDSPGSVKIRPTSVSASCYDDGGDVSRSREDLELILSPDVFPNTGRDVASLECPSSLAADGTGDQFQMEDRTPEESYRIFIDRNQSKVCTADREDTHSEFRYQTSEDGYEISFVDENKEIVRTLSLSSDFKHSYENTSRSRLSVDGSIFSDGSSEYSFASQSESRDDVSGEMERSIEYSIEFVDEDGKKERKTTRKRTQRTKRKKGKRRLVTTAIVNQGSTREFSKSYDGTYLQKAKSVEILFTNEAEPNRSSRLSLSGEFSQSCNEEIFLHYKPVFSDTEKAPDTKLEDYDILDNGFDLHEDSGLSSTPKSIRKSTKQPEGAWESQTQQPSISHTELQYERKDIPDLEKLSTIFENEITTLKYQVLPQASDNVKSSGTSIRSRLKSLFQTSTKNSQETKSENLTDQGDYEIIQDLSLVPLISNHQFYTEEKPNDYNLNSTLQDHPVLTDNALRKEEKMSHIHTRKRTSINFKPHTTTANSTTTIQVKQHSPQPTDDTITEPKPTPNSDKIHYVRASTKHNDINLRQTYKIDMHRTKLFFKPTPSNKLHPGLDNSLDELRDTQVDQPAQTNAAKMDVPELAVVNLKIGAVPSTEEVLQETVDVAVVESIDHKFDFGDDDGEEEGREDSKEGGEDVEEEPGLAPEEEEQGEDSAGKGPDEVEVRESLTTEIVPRRTVFRETVASVKEPTPVDSDDELKDIRGDEPAPAFITESVEEEKLGKGLVRTISGKVRGRFRRFFRGPEGDELELSEEIPTDEDKLHSIQPLCLEPVDISHAGGEDEPGTVVVNVKIGGVPSKEEVLQETVDVAVVESIDHEFDFGDDDDGEEEGREDSEEGGEDAEEEPGTAPEEEEQGEDSAGKGPDEVEVRESLTTEIVPRRTVFRETVASVKEPAPVDSDDELKDIRGDEPAPAFITESVEEEKLGKGLVRTISGKVRGRFRRFFRGPEGDELELSEEIPTDEDKLHSIQPLCLEPVDISHAGGEDEPGTVVVNVKIGGVPSKEEVLQETVDVAVVESIDHEFDFGDDDDGEEEGREDSEEGGEDAEEEPGTAPEEEEQGEDSAGKGPDEVEVRESLTTEIVPRRTVFRETVASVKEPTPVDSDDELKDIRGDEPAPAFITESVEEEKLGKGLVRTISGKVRGRFRRFFRGPEGDELELSEEIPTDEDKLHSIQPLCLEPVDISHAGGEDEPGTVVVNVKIGGVPSKEEVLQETVDVAVVESIDHEFDFGDDDDGEEEGREDSEEGGEDAEEEPGTAPEEEEQGEDSAGKGPDEVEVRESLTTEIVPRRTVFRETVASVKEPTPVDSDDELKDIRGDEPAPAFITESVEEEKLGKGLVRTISGKVRGRFRRFFRGPEGDELELSEEIPTDEDKLHSIQPLCLEPVDISHAGGEDEPGTVVVNVKIGGVPSKEEVLQETVDVAVVESIDHEFDFGDDDDGEEEGREDSEEGGEDAEEEPGTAPEEEEQGEDSAGKGPDEVEVRESLTTEIVPRRTVFRETVASVKEPTPVDSDDELKDIRGDEPAPAFITESVEEEKLGKGLVRTISGKVRGRFRRFFRGPEGDELELSEEIPTDEDKLHSIQPLCLEPVDISHAGGEDEPGTVVVNVKIGGVPSKEEVLQETVDVAVVESIDHEFDFGDDDDGEEEGREDSEEGGEDAEEEPGTAPEEEEQGEDSAGKGPDEVEVRESLTTEIVPRRTVFRETVASVKEPTPVDSDDELKDIRGDEPAPAFITESVEEEKLGKGLVRTISGKVRGRFRRFFRGPEGDELELSEEIPTDEDKLHSIQPLCLEPVDISHAGGEDEPGTVVVNVKIGGVPSKEEVLQETVDVAVVESIDHEFDFGDDDDGEEEGREDSEEGGEDAEEEPGTAPEEEEQGEDSAGKGPDEVEVRESLTTEIVPRRTVFRETVASVKEPTPVDSDDELKDIRGDEPAPAFITESVEEEKLGKGLVRTISGKVRGRFRRFFRGPEGDELELSEEIPTDEDKLHSIQPLCLEPVDISHAGGEDEPGKVVVNVKIGGVPSKEEVLQETVDVAVVESIDHEFDFGDDDDGEEEGREDSEEGGEDAEDEPGTAPEEEEEGNDSAGKGPDEVEVRESLTTEIVPRRTVFRETVASVKEPTPVDSDDELKDIRGDEPAPAFITESVEEEKLGKGLVRTISGKVRGRFRRFFRGPEGDELELSEEIPTDEDKLHSIQPLCLEPVDISHAGGEDEPGTVVVNVKIGGVPSKEEVLQETVDVAVVESIDHEFDFGDDDDGEEEGREDSEEGGEDAEEEPGTAPEEEEQGEDSAGKGPDEVEVRESLTTEIVPRRTVFRETVASVKEPTPVDSDDELKDIRGDEPAPAFITESVEEEKLGKGLVRTISGKVRGRFRRFFRGPEGDELELSEEIPTDEDKLHSIQPLCLEPVDISHAGGEDEPGTVVVNVKIGGVPSKEEVLQETVDVAVVESIDHEFDFGDDDDGEEEGREDSEEGGEDAEEEPGTAPEEEEQGEDSAGKGPDEVEVRESLTTEIVPRRTVFRETVASVKEPTPVDSDDELKDIRGDEPAPAFITESVEEEKLGKGLVRTISGKVRGRFRRFFRGPEGDELELSEEIPTDEDKLHSIQPLCLEPVDISHAGGEDEPGTVVVNVKIGGVPSKEEVLQETVDVAVVESIDHEFDFGDDDDGEEEGREDSEEGGEDAEEEPGTAPEEEEQGEDSAGKGPDEVEVRESLTTEIVPRRTVFRETVASVKEPTPVDSDDELKDIRGDEPAPAFITESVEEEKLGKGLVRTISGKVRGRFRRFFRGPEGDELELSEEIPTDEDKLHSIQPLCLEPVDISHAGGEDEPGTVVVNVKIGGVPSKEEVLQETVDVAVVESIDHEFDFGDDDDGEEEGREDSEEGGEDAEEEPGTAPEEEEQGEDSAGKGPDEVEVRESLTTEIVPRRTVFRETVASVKEPTPVDSDDELKDIRGDEPAPAFITESVEEEKLGKGLVRTISGKVRGRFRRFFRGPEGDELELSEEIPTDEDKLHSIQPLCLEPVDISHAGGEDEPGKVVVNVKIGGVPSKEEVLQETVDVAVVESIDHEFDFGDDDDGEEEGREDSEEGGEDAEDEPGTAPEEEEEGNDSAGKGPDEVEVRESLTTEIVPRRTVFRETVASVKEPTPVDSDDELKDIRGDEPAPAFITESVEEEKLGKGLVRTISGKVRGRFRRFFRGPEGDELELSEEIPTDEDKLHSIQPLCLEPVDISHAGGEDEPGTVVVNVKIGGVPSKEEVLQETVDVAVVESIDHEFDFGDDDDGEEEGREDSEEGGEDAEEEPGTAPEEEEEGEDSAGKGPDEVEVRESLTTEIVPRRTVFRETVASVKEPTPVDSDDELKDIRGDEPAPAFITESVEEEKLGKGLVRTISGKVRGRFRRFFRGPEGDELELSEEIPTDEDKLHSIQPLCLEPVDISHAGGEDEPGTVVVNVKIGGVPSKEEVLQETVDVAVVESIDHEFDFGDDDDGEEEGREDSEEGGEDAEEEPGTAPEEEEQGEDSAGKGPDEVEVRESLTTEIVPRRTVFRETVASVKEPTPVDSDDELKDIRGDEPAPAFIMESVEEEKLGKGLVRTISGKVRGRFRRFFRGPEGDELELSEEIPTDEDKLHSIQPLCLEPVDISHAGGEDEPGTVVVNVKIGGVPSKEEVLQETVDVAVVESIDHEFDFGDDDDGEEEGREDSEEGGEDAEEEPGTAPEEEEQGEDSAGKGPDEVEVRESLTTEIVPRRTVFRETVASVKEPTPVDSDDELKDIRGDEPAPAFITESVEEEKLGKGLVRTISGKVRGRFRRFFRGPEGDELELSEEIPTDEDKLHSIQPLCLEPVDISHAGGEDEPGTVVVNVKIGGVPSKEEVLQETVDVAVVESIDHEFDFGDDDDGEEEGREDSEEGGEDAEEEPGTAPEEEEEGHDSAGKGPDEVEVRESLTTEIVPRRTVFRETVASVKEPTPVDSDDELKDIRGDEPAPAFITESVEEERLGKGLVRTISGKVRGRFRRFFRGPEGDELELSEEIPTDEDKLHSIQPLCLEPVDISHAGGEDEPGTVVVNVKIGGVPSKEEVLQETVDVAVVESIDHEFDFGDDDDGEEEGREDSEEGGEDAEEEPGTAPEEEEEGEDSAGKGPDEVEVRESLTTEIVPRRTVFRETVASVKEPTPVDSDDELKDIRGDEPAPAFITESVEEEKLGKGLVRTISGKVRGRFRRFFRGPEGDELELSEEIPTDEDKLHSIQPLCLEPVDISHAGGEDEPGTVVVNVKIGGVPSKEEVLQETVDVAVVESIDHEFDFGDDDDGEEEGREDSEEGGEDAEEEPGTAPEEEEQGEDSAGKGPDEVEVRESLTTEIVPRRTVFRETVASVKEPTPVDSDDELKDIRGDEPAPAFITESVEEEKLGKGLVRTISGKVRGRFRRFFRGPEGDELELSEEIPTDEDKLHSIQPLCLEPVDISHAGGEDEPGKVVVNVKIGGVPSKEEVLQETVDVAVVESIDHEFDFGDDDDGEEEGREDSEEGGEDAEEEPGTAPEEEEEGEDSAGKGPDEVEVRESLTTEIVPRRTVFRETVASVKEPTPVDSDDELKDIRGDEPAPAFITESVEEEKLGKGLVRTISGKVRGRFRRFFRGPEGDELELSEEIPTDEDKLHSIQPLCLEPVDISHAGGEDEPGTVVVNVKIGGVPSKEEVLQETVDVAVVESIDHEFDFGDDDDGEEEGREDSEEGGEDAEEEPGTAPEEEEQGEDSAGKGPDEVEVRESLTTEIVPRRTVFRETVASVKEPTPVDSDDELKDIRGDEPAPAFITESVEEEKLGKGLVRTISGKVRGRFRRFFRGPEGDELELSEEIPTDEDKLHSIQPLCLEPVDISHAGGEDEPGTVVVNVKIGGVPSKEEVLQETVDVAVVESIDHEFDFGDDDDGEEEGREDSEEGGEDAEDEPGTAPEEEEEGHDSAGKGPDEVEVRESLTTEIVPRRTVFRETVASVKEPTPVDSDDDLKDIRGDEPAPAFITESVEEEKLGKGLVRTISGKVRGRFRRFFRGPEGDELELSEEIPTDEDKLHSIQPLCLEPVDISHAGGEDEPGMVVVNVKIGGVPSKEEVLQETVDVAVVESIDHEFDFGDDEDGEEEGREDSEEGGEDAEEEPGTAPEEEEEGEDSAGKGPDEVEVRESLTTEIVPRRTVFRETVASVKEPTPVDSDDELKDIRGDEPAPAFITESVEEERLGKGLVRTISGKVRGRFRRFFRGPEGDELELSEEIPTDEDKLHSIQPLCLEPVEISHAGGEDEPGTVVVNVKIGGVPSKEEVLQETVDVAVVESIDHEFDFGDDDDGEEEGREDSEEGGEDAEEEPGTAPEEEEEGEDSAGKGPDEVEVRESLTTEIVPRRTVFRETVASVKEPTPVNSDDELKDIRGDEPAPAFITESVEEEKLGKGLVRTISGKVRGRFRRFFRGPEGDELELSEEIPTDEDKLHSIQPLCLEPVDISHAGGEDEPGTVVVNVKIGGVPSKEEVLLETVDVAVVESIDHEFDFGDDDDGEEEGREDSEEGGEDAEEEPGTASEEEEEGEDSAGKGPDEVEVRESLTTEIVPRRTVFRETVASVKEPTPVDSDDQLMAVCRGNSNPGAVVYYPDVEVLDRAPVKEFRYICSSTFNFGGDHRNRDKGDAQVSDRIVEPIDILPALSLEPVLLDLIGDSEGSDSSVVSLTCHDAVLVEEALSSPLDKDSIDDEDVLPPLFLSLDAVDDVTEDSGEDEIEDQSQDITMLVEFVSLLVDKSIQAALENVSETASKQNIKKAEPDMTVEDYLTRMKPEEPDMTVEEYLTMMKPEEPDMTVEEYLTRMKPEEPDMTVEEYLTKMKPEEPDMTVEEYLTMMKPEEPDMTVEEYLTRMKPEEPDMTVEEYLKMMKPEEPDMTVEEYLTRMKPEEPDMTVEEYLKMMKPDEPDMTVEEYLTRMKPEEPDMTVEEYLKMMKPEEPDMTVEEYLTKMKPEEPDMTGEEYLTRMKPEEPDMNVEEYLKMMKPEEPDMTVEEYLKMMKPEEPDMTVEEYLKMMKPEEPDMIVEEYLTRMKPEEPDMTVEEYLTRMKPEEPDMTVEEYLKMMKPEEPDMTVEEYLTRMKPEEPDMTVEEYLKMMKPEEPDMTVEEYLKMMKPEEPDMTVEEYLKMMKPEEADMALEINAISVLYFGYQKSIIFPFTTEHYSDTTVQINSVNTFSVEDRSVSIIYASFDHSITGPPDEYSTLNSMFSKSYNDILFQIISPQDLEVQSKRPYPFGEKLAAPGKPREIDNSEIVTLEDIVVEEIYPDFLDSNTWNEDPQITNDGNKSDVIKENLVDDMKTDPADSDLLDMTLLAAFDNTDVDSQNKLDTNTIEPFHSEPLMQPSGLSHCTEMLIFKINHNKLAWHVTVFVLDFPRGFPSSNMPQDQSPCSESEAAECSEHAIEPRELKNVEYSALSVLYYQVDWGEQLQLGKLCHEVSIERFSKRAGDVPTEKRGTIDAPIERCDTSKISKVMKDMEKRYGKNSGESVKQLKVPEVFTKFNQATNEDEVPETDVKKRRKLLENRWKQNIVENQRRDGNYREIETTEVIDLSDVVKSSGSEKLPFDVKELKGNAKVSAYLQSNCDNLRPTSAVAGGQLQKTEQVEELEEKVEPSRSPFRRSRSRQSRDIPRVVMKRSKTLPAQFGSSVGSEEGTETFTESDDGSMFAVTGSPGASPRASFRKKSRKFYSDSDDGSATTDTGSHKQLPSSGSSFAVTGSYRRGNDDREISKPGVTTESEENSGGTKTNRSQGYDSDLSSSDTLVDSENGSTFAVTGSRVRRLSSDGSSFAVTGSPGLPEPGNSFPLPGTESEEEGLAEKGSAFAMTGRRSQSSVTSEGSQDNDPKQKPKAARKKLATFV